MRADGVGVRPPAQSTVPDLGHALDELVAVAEREHDCAERVLHRVVVLRTMLRAGETRFLDLAADELDEAERELSTVGVLRAAVAEEVGRMLGYPAGTELALRAIAEASPPAWRLRLEGIHRAMRAVVEEIVEVRGEAAELIDAHQNEVSRREEEVRAQAEGAGAALWGGYGPPDGSASASGSPAPVRFDEGA